MCKGTIAQKIPAILNSASEAGIWNLLFVIFGFPTETKAEWRNTLDFLGSIHDSVHALSRSRFILLEGSQVFCNPQRYGIKRIIDRPQRDPVSIAYDYEVTEGLTQEEAEAMFQENLARLSGLGRSPWFGQFREHMLLFASRQEMRKESDRAVWGHRRQSSSQSLPRALSGDIHRPERAGGFCSRQTSSAQLLDTGRNQTTANQCPGCFHSR